MIFHLDSITNGAYVPRHIHFTKLCDIIQEMMLNRFSISILSLVLVSIIYPQLAKNLIEIVNVIDDEEPITRPFIICFLQNLKESFLIPYNQSFINEKVIYIYIYIYISRNTNCDLLLI